MRQDQWNVTLRIDGTDLGTWDKKTGGKLVASTTKNREGGMGPTVAYGGPSQVEDVTLTRTFKRDRDLPIWPFIKGRVGKGTCTVSQQPLDADGNAFGRPIVFTGVLMSADGPEVDSNSDDLSEIILEISTNGTIG